MPWAPKPPCRVCRRVGCTDPTHRRRPFDSARSTGERRPEWDARRTRRRAVFEAWRAQYGDVCPRCRRTGVKLTADHVHPVALDGAEDGPLGVLCMACQRSQGARIANAKRCKPRPY